MIKRLLALFRRREPSLYQRCLAVHVAATTWSTRP